MARIVAGSLGGRRLVTPAGSRTRPTADQVREGLFNTLTSLTDLAGARFADLFAGSGAVGLEAHSRGAAHVLLVESDPKAAAAARANIAALGATSSVRLVAADVERTLATGPRPDGSPDGAGSPGSPGDAYDIVFADPPYAMRDDRLAAMQRALVDTGWLAYEAIIVVERASRSAPLQWVSPVTGLRSRRYGETTLWYGRRS